MTKSKRRSFTAEFKTQVVLEVIGGIKTFSEVLST
jgi:transposase-like protein